MPKKDKLVRCYYCKGLGISVSYWNKTSLRDPKCHVCHDKFLIPLSEKMKYVRKFKGMSEEERAIEGIDSLKPEYDEYKHFIIIPFPGQSGLLNGQYQKLFRLL